jgi:hypothetical protein
VLFFKKQHKRKNMLNSTTMSHSSDSSQNKKRQTPATPLRQSDSASGSKQGQSETGSFEILSVQSNNSIEQITNRLETASISNSTQGQLILDADLPASVKSQNILHNNEGEWENLSDASSSEGVHVKLDESIIKKAKKDLENAEKQKKQFEEIVKKAQEAREKEEIKKNTALQTPPEMIVFTAADKIDMKNTEEQTEAAKIYKAKKDIERQSNVAHNQKIPNALQHEFNNLIDNQTALIKENAHKTIKNAVSNLEDIGRKATVIVCDAVISSAKKIKKELSNQTDTPKANKSIQKEKTD